MSEFQRRLEANIRESLRFAVGEVQDDAVAHMVAGVNAVLNHPCAPAPQEHVDVEAEIASVVQSVNEWDDRTSPDDYPEHLLITSEELSEILRNFAATLEGSDNG